MVHLQSNVTQKTPLTHNCNSNMFKQGFHYTNSEKNLHCSCLFARTNIETALLYLETHKKNIQLNCT